MPLQLDPIQKTGIQLDPISNSDPGVFSDFGTGFTKDSIIGMQLNHQLPPPENPNSNFVDRLARNVGGMVADIPIYAAGAAAGEGVGSMVTSMALHEGLRKAVVDSINNGEAKSLPELASRLGGAAVATGKGAAVGAAFGVAGKVPGLLAIPAQAAAGTVVGAALEGRIPTASDFFDNAILIGGFHGLGKSYDFLTENYVKTGELPGDASKRMEAGVPPITPPPIAANVIGLRPISQKFSRMDVLGNIMKSALNKPLQALGHSQLILKNVISNPAILERARVQHNIDSNAAILGDKAAYSLGEVFEFDKNGMIPSLAGIDPTLPGAPSIQDVAARYPLFVDHLSLPQQDAMAYVKSLTKPYEDVNNEVGNKTQIRKDIMNNGGFYLHRGYGEPEDYVAPKKVTASRGIGSKKGYEKPTTFDSMAQGISLGYKYSTIGEALRIYAHDAGTKALDAHIANYFKTVTDDTGQLIGESPKQRMLRQNPALVARMDELNKKFDRLKAIPGALSAAQNAAIDAWRNDPNFTDIDGLWDTFGAKFNSGKTPTPYVYRNFRNDKTQEIKDKLADKLSPTVPKGRFVPQLGVYVKSKSPYAGMDLSDVMDAKNQVMADIQALKPDYKSARDHAALTPRDEESIGLPGLQGYSFATEIANPVNDLLNKEGRDRGAHSPVINIINAFNNQYRGIRATADLSYLGIQGLLGLGSHPETYRQAMTMAFKAWGINGEKALGQFLAENDAMVAKTGHGLTSTQWAQEGVHFGGANTEMSIGGGGKPGGIGEKLGQLPIAKQANRAFGYFGDAMRYSWANAELKNQLVKRSLDEIRASGDLERIADGVNTMTGWSKTKTFGSVGDFVTFAPRWFQSRLNTIYKAAKGLRPNATLDQAMARNSLLRLIGAGTLLTYAVNTSLGNETDTRMIVDGKRNPHFMRINYEGHYYNLFGPWDSLLGMFINVGTGKTPTAIRSMASGSVAMAWDLITGKDYNYKPTHDNPADFAVWLGKSFVPFSWNQIPADVGNIYQGAKEGDTKKVIGNTVNIVGQVAGVKDYPISPVMDLQYKWAPDFKQYNAIPTNPIEVKASHGVTRDKYRERNPDVDAKLFITGQVNTVATVTAANKVLRMITENKINPDDINGVKSNRADRDKTMQLGMRYSGNTPTDRLVRLLDQRAATNP